MLSQLPASIRVILIGGTSHTGKSTLANYLAGELEWEYQSTDKLARHPGRPWRNDESELPQHVREHYASLAVDELIADVLRHYETNVLPKIQELIQTRVVDPSARGLVLEGSALWPAFVADFVSPQIGAVWITASDDLVMQRMREESRYETRLPHERLLIDKFLARTLAFGKRLQDIVSERGLPNIHIAANESEELLAQRCLRKISNRIDAA